MNKIQEKLRGYKLDIPFLNNLTRDSKEKVIVLILLIIILSVFVYAVIKYFNFAIYEPIDHEKKLIIFGETCDLENNQVSKDYSLGYKLAFDYINRNGGVNDYALKIILLNDKYEPDLAIKNAKLLTDYYNVLGLIGSFGTPTSVGIISEAIKSRPIPLIGPFSAGTSYRKYFNKYLILMNGTFYLEFELLVQSLLKNSYQNISVVFQNDIYGNYFYNAFVDYNLGNNFDFNIVSTGKYERNSNDLDGCFKSLFDVKNAYNYPEYTYNRIDNIDAVIIFAAEKEIKQIIGQLKKIKPTVAIYYNFFVGTNTSNVEYLKDENKENIYQTLLSHGELNDYPELNKILLDELNAYNQTTVQKIEQINSSFIQGFYSGLMIAKVLGNFKDMHEVNRESFTNMFYKMKTINVYGLPIGPFELDKNNEGVRYAEINQLQEDLTFRKIGSITKGEYVEH